MPEPRSVRRVVSGTVASGTAASGRVTRGRVTRGRVTRGRGVRGTVIRSRIGVVVAVSLASMVTSLGIAGSAGAASQPTVAQVQKRLAALDSRSSKLGQQYDAVLQQLSLANQRLRVLNAEKARYQATFDRMRAQVGKLAAVAYEQGGADSPLALLTSSTPQQVLDQASILSELAVADSAQISQYIDASRQLLDAQHSAARVRAGILGLKRSMAKRLAVLNALKQKQETLLADLTPSQQAGAGPGGGNGGGTYKGPTGTQADTAVAFAYDHIGCPYVWGGTGPCAAGFDCSGLMMASWSAAGISIPRTSYDQMGSLNPVPLHTASGKFTEEYLQPGDILGFNGNSHVGMYVGNGYLIDAPVPGEDVEKVALAGWYLQTLDGAVRP